MKQFIAFVRKEFHHILRDRRTMLILIGMPIVQIILFGFAISTEVRNVQTAILAPSLQTDVRKVMEQLDASEYFTVKYIVQSPDEIERLFRRNLIELAVVFPSDLHRLRFGSEEIQILADATDPNLAVTRSTYAQTVLKQAMQTLRQTTTTSAYSQPDKQPVMVNYKVFMVPALMTMILVLLCGFLPALNVVSEKEAGTIEQINVSPVSRFTFTLAKLLPYWAIGFVVLNLCMLLAWLVYGLTPAGNVLTIYLATLIFALVMSGLGLVISNYSSTMQQAMFVMWFCMLIFILMSGLFTPISSMPEWAQGITYLNPLRYFMEIMRMVYLKESGICDIGFQLSVLSSFALLLYAWAIRSYRKQQ